MTEPMLSDRVATLPRRNGTGAPAGRLKVLTEIAIHYRELVEPAIHAQRGNHDPGEGIALMPPTYTPTVREFERLCRLMRDDRHHPLIRLDNGAKVSLRRLWWHLNEWHLKAEPVIVWKAVTVKHKTKRRPTHLRDGEGQIVKRPERGWRRHPQSNESLAVEALRWMAAAWNLATEPMLPDELREAA